jgi:Skp family chaperone for outer membrane proteins
VSALVSFGLSVLAIIVGSAIIYLARAIVNAGRDLRENKVATQKNTEKLDEVTSLMNGRMTAIETDVQELKRKLP